MGKEKVENEVREVFPQDLVTVEYTSKASYHKPGETDRVHRLIAERLEKRSIAKRVVKKTEESDK